VNLKRRQLLQCAGVALAASALSGFAWSQAPAYPSRTVRIVVSSLPGGGPDIAARLLCLPVGDGLSWSKTAPEQPAILAPAKSQRPSLTATPCWRRSRLLDLWVSIAIGQLN
jgi:hypothetical protein